MRQSQCVSAEDARAENERANLAYFRRALADDSFVAWLATDQNDIVGTSGLCFSVVPPTLNNPDGRVAYVMNIYTVPSHRKRGVASELLARIVEEATGRGCRKITLNATRMGKPLYEKFGFSDEIGDMALFVDPA